MFGMALVVRVRKSSLRRYPFKLLQEYEKHISAELHKLQSMLGAAHAGLALCVSVQCSWALHAQA